MKVASLIFASVGLAAEVAKNIADASIGQLATMVITHEEKGGRVTQLGEIKVGLFTDDLPKTTDNFAWACENHFANSTFHRVIPNFMAQAGDFTEHNGTGGVSKFGRTFADEAFPYKHSIPGVLSMANRGPDTNGSQFFITFVNTPWLDNKHVVFGCITEGWTTLQKIEGKGSQSGRPQGTIKIKSCSVERVSGGRNLQQPLKCYNPNAKKSDL